MYDIIAYTERAYQLKNMWLISPIPKLSENNNDLQWFCLGFITTFSLFGC